MRILLVTPPDSETAALADELRRVDQYELQIASNDFEVGMKTGDFHPHVILVDILSEAMSAKEIIRNLRLNLSLTATRIVALAGAPTGGRKRTLMRQGFDDVISSPYKFDKLVAAIEAATDIISQVHGKNEY